MSDIEIRKAILTVLLQCGPHKLPESGVVQSIQQLSAEDVVESAVKMNLQWLEAKGFVDFVKGDLGDDEKRWFITAEGRKKVK